MSYIGGETFNNATISFLEDLGGRGSSGGASGGAGSGGARGRGRSIAPVSSDWTPIGDPRIYDPYSKRKYFDIAQGFDTDEHRDRLVNSIYGEGIPQRDRARSAEQRMGNYPYYYWNLAKDNPRGNLNMLPYDMTLRMSRLADVVNNRLHWNPGTASTIGGAEGAKTVGQGTGDIERWDSIETEEMRQMQANREIDRRAREAGVDLQSRIQAYPQEIQEEMDKLARELRNYIAKMDDDFVSWFQKELIVTEYGGSWKLYFEQKMREYLNELDLKTKSRIYEQLAGKLPAIANVLGRVFVNGWESIPFADYWLNILAEEMINTGELDWGGFIELFKMISSVYAGMVRTYDMFNFNEGYMGAGPAGGAAQGAGSSHDPAAAARARISADRQRYRYNR